MNTRNLVLAYAIVDSDSGEIVHGKIYKNLARAKTAWSKMSGWHKSRSFYHIQPLSALLSPIDTREYVEQLKDRAERKRANAAKLRAAKIKAQSSSMLREVQAAEDHAALLRQSYNKLMKGP
jgi:hypothetical protein